MNDKLYTIPEVASYLKISKSKVYWLVQTHKIPHVRIGRNVRIREQDLEKWLNLQLVGVIDRALEMKRQ